MLMSWSSLTNSLIGDRLIEIRGNLSDGNSQTKFFYLNVKPNCAIAVLTPMWSSLYQYYIDASNPILMPLIINFNVVSDVSLVDCGPFSFQLIQSDSPNPPGPDAALYAWSPIAGLPFQTMTVLPTDTNIVSSTD